MWAEGPFQRAFGTLYPAGSGGMLPREFLKMHTLRDAFSLILGAKSRAFRTDFYQVTGNKVMMNWVLTFFLLFINI